jgi:hypothetical protein
MRWLASISWLVRFSTRLSSSACAARSDSSAALRAVMSVKRRHRRVRPRLVEPDQRLRVHRDPDAAAVGAGHAEHTVLPRLARAQRDQERQVRRRHAALVLVDDRRERVAPGAPSSCSDVRDRMRSALTLDAIRLPFRADQHDAFVQRRDHRPVALLAVAQALLDALALHELADLAAQRAQHRQVIVVGLAGRRC